MLRPTFNTIPVSSDSSFRSTKGIDQTVLNCRKNRLDKKEAEVVERYVDIYDAVPPVEAT